MRKSRAVAVAAMALAFLVAADARLTAAEPPQQQARPTVSLRAATGATIRFWTQNGEKVDGMPPDARHIPHLVLYRNGMLTIPRERTLIVELTHIPVSPAGVTVTLEITTQHADPDAVTGLTEGIPVWREIRHIASTSGSAETQPVIVLTRTFSGTVVVDAREAPTPTDYYRYRIAIDGSETVGATSAFELTGDHSFLMERQWIVPLPRVRETPAGAGPGELIVYFCDMFPFQGIETDAGTRLSRSAVPHFVRSDLLPRMVVAYRTQTDTWGFSWHPEWTSVRLGEDERRLSIALTDGQTWYHDLAPAGGHAAISLNTHADDERAPYDSLSDDLISTFHHELFHNLQRSVNQHLGGDGRVGGLDDAWVLFSEGTAYLASSVGLPGVHFGLTRFRGARTSSTGTPLPSDMAGQGTTPMTGPILYWRFLYEQCGGMSGGVEDPGAGMAVVRNALWALYSGDIVNTEASTDLLGALPTIMDRALVQTPSCPFHTFEASLLDFARALYSLRLDGGRCTQPGTPAGCGLFDPHSLYRAPNVWELAYSGKYEEFQAHSWTMLDIDFFEVALAPTTDGQPLEVVIEPDASGDAAFIMQVWKLLDGDPDSGLRPVPEEIDGPEVVGEAGPGGRIRYIIPAIEPTEFNRLALIITRVGGKGKTDPIGSYAVRLAPAR